ncbi:hypothetical protein [Emcibacter sp.]|uniref:hypothetical protein n=1 Tax=Emcibacter sp. TaxID=1979954 RepID=UPI003A932BCD
MKSGTRVIFLSLLLATGLAQAGHAECEFPKRPVIPDGKTVSRDHLLEVIHVFKSTFQPEVRSFQNCIKNEQIAVGDLATSEQTEEWTARHDAAYQIEERLAGLLNQAIRDFKAREAAGEDVSGDTESGTTATTGTGTAPDADTPTGDDDTSR